MKLILFFWFLISSPLQASILDDRLRLEAFALSGKNPISTNAGMAGAVGINYEIVPSLLTVIKLRGSGETSEQDGRRDQDLVSTAGNKIELVSEENKTKYIETGLEQMIGYRFELGNHELRPFLLLGYARGNATSTKSLMTNRAHFALFSNHNRYTYTYDQEYDRQTLGGGFEFLFAKNFLASVAYRYSAYRFKSMITKVDVKGESPEFLAEDIASPTAFNNAHNTEIAVGFGYQF